jgi:hypothetical protein
MKYDEIGVLYGDHVVGRRLEVVRIGIRRQDRGYVDAVAADLSHQVGQNAGRRHHLERSIGTAGNDRQRDRRGKGRDGGFLRASGHARGDPHDHG